MAEKEKLDRKFTVRLQESKFLALEKMAENLPREKRRGRDGPTGALVRGILEQYLEAPDSLRPLTPQERSLYDAARWFGTLPPSILVKLGEIAKGLLFVEATRNSRGEVELPFGRVDNIFRALGKKSKTSPDAGSKKLGLRRKRDGIS